MVNTFTVQSCDFGPTIYLLSWSTELEFSQLTHISGFTCQTETAIYQAAWFHIPQKTKRHLTGSQFTGLCTCHGLVPMSCCGHHNLQPSSQPKTLALWFLLSSRDIFFKINQATQSMYFPPNRYSTFQVLLQPRSDPPGFLAGRQSW